MTTNPTTDLAIALVLLAVAAVALFFLKLDYEGITYMAQNERQA
jgi:hypothetical protein